MLPSGRGKWTSFFGSDQGGKTAAVLMIHRHVQAQPRGGALRLVARRESRAILKR
jgi:hypothetical protein